MEESTSGHVSFDELKTFCSKAYARVGVPADEAGIAGGLLARAELRGVESHGVTKLPIYIQRVQKGMVRAACRLTALNEKGGTAWLDAHGSMGHVVAHKAMGMAIQKAEAHGIGWVSVKDSGHFGVTGLYPMMAADRGLIGYVTSNSAPMMAPWGGSERIIGNNPLAYAFPTEQYPTVVLDLSCSVVSAGRLILSRKKGEKIPLGWAFDKNGLPTEDPYEGHEGGGSLAPIGGYKGYGMVVAHEMLTSILSGGKWAREIKNIYEEDKSGIQGTCHSFMALDPDCFCGRDTFRKGMDRYIRDVKGSRKAGNATEILMPGEPEHRTEVARLKGGIPLSAVTLKDLSRLAESLEMAGLPDAG